MPAGSSPCSTIWDCSRASGSPCWPRGHPATPSSIKPSPWGASCWSRSNSRYTLAELEAACNDCAPHVLFTDLRRKVWRRWRLWSFPWDLGSTGGMLVEPPTATRWEVDEDDPAVVFYTGGTTDRAKGVVLSHRSKLADACP